MSKVKSRVFEVSKEIENDTARNTILKLYNGLHKSEDTNQLGYFGRKQYRQFLGYLQINSRKDEINLNFPGEISDMSNETYESFLYGHNYLKKINEMCLSPLIEQIPAAFKIVDPYWELDSQNKFYSVVTIQNNKLDNLVRSFQLSKPYKIIQKKLLTIPGLKDMKEQDVINGFFGMKNRIKKYGLQNCPEELFEIVMKINQNTQTSLFSSVMFSLLYINSALQCIDQILFQKFTSNKLISLGEDNISNIYNMSSNSLSNTYELLSTEPVLFCGDILHLEIPDNSRNIKDFCIIEELKISFSQDYGNEFKVGLRGTDDNFSYYGNLLSNIEV